MNTMIGADKSHEPSRRSWVESANILETDFPIQNLPLGCGLDRSGRPVTLVAIGDRVLDLSTASDHGLLDDVAAATLGSDMHLNRLLARPPRELTALRHRLGAILEQGSPDQERLLTAEHALRPAVEVELLTPTKIGSFTDFYAGIYHALEATRVLLKQDDVGPNYRWVPIAYQSRSSTVRPTGARVRRPKGQLPAGNATARYAPTMMLDFELELGMYVGAGTELERPVPIGEAADHIAGFCLLNDWTARDVQRWEMAPLGPFLSKSFATTISPWVITVDALKPFRVSAMPRSEHDPPALPYLHDQEDQANGGLAVELSVWLQTPEMRTAGDERALLLRSDARHLYWTPAQLLAHHTSNGCDLQSGDLLGTGTISGPEPEQLGSLLELTEDAHNPARLPNGEQRGYLQDGDEVTFTARCVRNGYVSIGFGQCSGRVMSAEES